MFEQSQRQVDADLARSKNLFERSAVGKVVPVEPRRPKKVLLVLDSSSQDATAISFVETLKEQHGCQLQAMIFPPFATQTATEASANALSQLDVDLLPVDQRENYEQILEAIVESKVDLVVLPCPFGRDFDAVGADSTGTVIDVLIARCPVPFAVIRKPFGSSEPAFGHVRLILTDENAAAHRAAESGLGILAGKGRVELLLLVEESYYENIRATMQGLQPEMEINYEDLEGALAKTFARLHTSLQRASSQHHFQYELLVRHESETDYSLSVTDDEHQKLFVLALERGDHRSEAQVHDFVRRSAHPVLIVDGS